jgi:hypothetical protein
VSTHVVNELFAQPGRGDDVAYLLIDILVRASSGRDELYFGTGNAARTG